jgi:hypothetical protein
VHELDARLARRGHALVLGLVAWLVASEVWAAEFSGGSIVVERAETAAECPDEASLVRATLALGTLPAAASPPLNVEVAFRHEPTGYVAQITATGRTEGVREVTKDGDTCAPLAEAVSVVLAVLFDLAPRVEEPAPARAPVPPPSPPVETPLGPGVIDEPRPSRSSLGAGVEAGAAYGLLGGALVGTLGGAVRPRWGHWELAAGALWAPGRTVDYSPGTVSLSLVAGRAEGCGWLRDSARRPDLGLCAGFLAGALRGHGRGFREEGSAVDAWLALEAGVAGRWPLSSNFALRLGISLLVPTRKQSFSVKELGSAYESSPVAGVAELGPELRFP